MQILQLPTIILNKTLIHLLSRNRIEQEHAIRMRIANELYKKRVSFKMLNERIRSEIITISVTQHVVLM
jgi:hypothetical protein